jgi:hypothetical protein
MVFAQEATSPAGIYNPALPYTWGKGGAELIAELIGKLLNLAFMVGGLILIIMIIVSGIQWMLAGGDKQAIASAQGRLASAIIGFVILASTYAVVSLVGHILNVEFLQTFIIKWPTP